MENRKNLILNKALIFILALLMFRVLNAYTAAEYLDREMPIDEFSQSSLEHSYYNLFRAGNVLHVSGGCYNVENLIVSDYIKLNIPLNKTVSLRLFHMKDQTFEFDNQYLGYGLFFRLNDAFKAGFMASPTYLKKEADIGVAVEFSGFNTNTVAGVMFRNFDNNYSFKYYPLFIPEPRLYTYPKILDFGYFQEFPVNLYLMTSGEFRNIEFYSVFVNELLRKEDRFTIDSSAAVPEDRFVYAYSADSSKIYSRTYAGITFDNNYVNGRTGLKMTIISMDNKQYTLTDTIADERDRRIEIGWNSVIKKNTMGIETDFTFAKREIDTLYSMQNMIYYVGYIWENNRVLLQVGEMFGDLYSKRSDYTDPFDRIETRCLVSFAYKFNEHAYMRFKKGLETDPADIRNGGRFFFYDKIYVQFHMTFDHFIRPANG